MKNAFLTIILIILSFPSYSQDEEYPGTVSSTIPQSSRYEIIQSNLIARFTFKIDKYSGNVYQLVSDTADVQSWSKMKRIKHVSDVIVNKSKVNYQLFTSGITVRFTYLVNIDTGASWLLVKDDEDNNLWEPIYDN